MALLDKVISEVAAKFGLGSSATALVREILTLVVDSPGGFGGFLNRVKSAGLGTELTTWVGNPNAAPLLHTQVEKIFGSTVLSGVAQKLGLGDSVVSTATGFLLPKLSNKRIVGSNNAELGCPVPRSLDVARLQRV